MTIQYRRFGNSKLKVSALCLGTMMFGQQATFEEAGRIAAAAREHDINLSIQPMFTTSGSRRAMSARCRQA